MTAPATFGQAAQSLKAGPDLQGIQYPPIRQNNQPDDSDNNRVTFCKDRWAAQDGLLLAYSRQIEFHCRMLAGQQWDVWSEALERFVDVNTLFSTEERLWRQRPVMDMVKPWFMLTHARLTENPPILAFQPATADRGDAQLAETFDTVFKTLWNDVHMPEVTDEMIRWLVAAGTGFIKSYPTYKDTENAQPRVGPAEAQVPDPETGDSQPMELDQPVPYSPQGEPQFELQQHPETGEMMAVPTAEPEMEPGGGLEACSLNPLQVRGEWNHKPWHEKAWHMHKDYFTPQVIFERWGVEVIPDVTVSGSEQGPGYLERLLFNEGYYGAVQGNRGAIGNGQFGVGTSPADGYTAVYELWEKKSPQNDKLGRLLITTKDKVLYDGPNPFPRLKGASPIRRYQFVGIPGRPSGTTPLESLIPLQQSYNRGWAQELEHRSLMTNPMILRDESASLDDEQFVATPGMHIKNGMRNGMPLIAPFAMPPLSKDFYQTQDRIRDLFMYIGNISGAEGTPPTEDSSGALVEQLRANADRYIGPTARGLVMEMSRLAEDWLAIIEVIWDTPKLLTYAGEDNVPQTIAVEPNLWQGDVHAIPDVESMLPESRAAKQGKLMQLYQAGLFGPPADPATAAKLAPMFNFPSLNRALKPGGVDAVTASQNLGQLLLGTPAAQIPLFPAYDFNVHVGVTNQYIKAPEFKRATPEIQQQILAHVERLQETGALMMIQQAQQTAATHTGVMHAVQTHSPPAPPPQAPAGPGGQAGKSANPIRGGSGKGLVDQASSQLGSRAA